MRWNRNLYIITGGPGAGKTATLLELHKMGFAYIPEVARQIIQEQVRAEGMALPWRNRAQYSELMHERSVQTYRMHARNTQLTFADRGIPDTLAYARLIRLPLQGKIARACARFRYGDQVFIAPPWAEIYQTDAERKQDFREAVRTYDGLVQTYKDCNYELIELPKLPPVERAKFILETLSSPTPNYQL